MFQIDYHPSERTLRQFGWIALVGFGAVGGLVAWRSGLAAGEAGPIAQGVVALCAALALVCPLLGVVRPALLRPIFIALTAITLPIGFVVSHAVMALVYYLVLTPIGLVFRLMGRDALKRRFEPDAPTYWERRPAPPPAERYFREF